MRGEWTRGSQEGKLPIRPVVRPSAIARMRRGGEEPTVGRGAGSSEQQRRPRRDAVGGGRQASLGPGGGNPTGSPGEEGKGSKKAEEVRRDPVPPPAAAKPGGKGEREERGEQADPSEKKRDEPVVSLEKGETKEKATDEAGRDDAEEKPRKAAPVDERHPREETGGEEPPVYPVGDNTEDGQQRAAEEPRGEAAFTAESMAARVEANFRTVVGEETSVEADTPSVVDAMVAIRTHRPSGYIFEGEGKPIVESHGLDHVGEGIDSIVVAERPDSEKIVSLFKDPRPWTAARLEGMQLRIDILRRLFPKNFPSVELFQGTVNAPDGREVTLTGAIRTRVIPRVLEPGGEERYRDFLERTKVIFPLNPVRRFLSEYHLPMGLDEFNPDRTENEIVDRNNATVYLDLPTVRGTGSFQGDKVRAYMEGRDPHYRPQRVHTPDDIREVMDMVARITEIELQEIAQYHKRSMLQ